MSAPVTVARAKLLVARYGRLLVVVLGVVAIVSMAGAGWVYAHPPTTEVTERTNQQTFGTEMETSAVVTGDSSLYERGTTLRNQPVYLDAATPNVTLSFRTSVPDRRPVNVTQRVDLVFRATHGSEEFWNRTRPLVEERATVENGRLTTSATLDVAALEREVRTLESELAGVGTVKVELRVRTDYETGRYDGTLRGSTGVAFSDRSYSISPVSLERTEATRHGRVVTVPNPDRTVPLALAGLGGLASLAAGGLRVVLRREDGWAGLENDVQQARYEEWISEGTVSLDRGGRSVPVASLEDLVDVAIDTNKRVIHDPERGAYVVLDGEVTYVYDSSPRPDSGFEYGNVDE